MYIISKTYSTNNSGVPVGRSGQKRNRKEAESKPVDPSVVVTREGLNIQQLAAAVVQAERTRITMGGDPKVIPIYGIDESSGRVVMTAREIGIPKKSQDTRNGFMGLVRGFLALS